MQNSFKYYYKQFKQIRIIYNNRLCLLPTKKNFFRKIKWNIFLQNCMVIEGDENIKTGLADQKVENKFNNGIQTNTISVLLLILLVDNSI